MTPAESLVNHIIEAVSESLEEDEGALREALAEEGINYDDLVKEGTQFIESLRRRYNAKV